MKTAKLTWMTAALVAACAGNRGASPTSAPCLVDLSHPYDEETVYWPTAPSRFEKTTLAHGMTASGYFYAAYAIATPEHGGTHIDAPIHFAEGQATTDAIPLERLIAPAVVVDMTESASQDADALLSVEHIEQFEREHGAVDEGSIVLVRSGWARFWPDAKRYLGNDVPGDASNLHFPGISESAALALAKRRVAAVGIDTASLDHGPSKLFLAHRVLAEAGIPGFENVANLERIPPRGAEVIALPMKIAGGSGGPLRIVARVARAACVEP